MFGRLSVIMAGLALAQPALAAPSYTLAKTTLLGAPDRWDYVVFDRPTQRVYIAHGDRLAVLDARSGDLAGEVDGISGGAHGTGVSAGTGQGFTDDGRNGLALSFDLKTLTITKSITVQKDADAIAADGFSGHIFVVEGDPGTISVIDPGTRSVIDTIAVGEGLEYAAADDQGALFVAGVQKSDLIKIDTRTNAVLARWPASECVRPHGLAVDKAGRRIFMGCVNSLMLVMDADSGSILARLPIGRGSDAIAFDPVRKRIFSPNGVDGTLTIIQQAGRDSYRVLETLPTLVSGRTMAVDPATGRLYIVAAETDPSPTAGGRPRPRPGSARVLIYDPADK